MKKLLRRSTAPPPKKRVILHHEKMKESLEGIWSGMTEDGHYILEAPKLVFEGDRKPMPLSGPILVPKAKVAFVQVLAEDASV